jgi:hypothetical protein
MHASRTQSTGLYLVSAAVLLTELLKLAACLSFAAARSAPRLTLRYAADGAAFVARTALPVALPAVLVRARRQRAGGRTPVVCPSRAFLRGVLFLAPRTRELTPRHARRRSSR